VTFDPALTITGPDGRHYRSKRIDEMMRWEMADCLAAATIEPPHGELYSPRGLRMQRAEIFVKYIVMDDEKLRELMRELFKREGIHPDGGSLLVPVK
jgi:hypothetical protein